MDAVDFITQFPIRIFHKGEAILNEGEIANLLLFIDSGFIKVTSLDDSGVEHMLWIAGPEDAVPSERFFSRTNHLNFFYTALTEVRARAVDKTKYLEHTASNPLFMADVAASMSDYYDDLLLRIHAIEQSNIRDKLIATLRYLSERFGRGHAIDLHQLGLPLTHQDLAEMIGSTRETTSVELQKLRQDGFVEYDRSHFVINPDALLQSTT